MKLIENLRAFSQETSIHAINIIGKPTYSNTVRISWLALFIGALSYALIQISYEAEGNYINYDFASENFSSELAFGMPGCHM